MTKLFVVGDFHGKLSNSLFSKIKKEKPDFILSSGDFCGNENLSKIFFKYIYGKHEDAISSEIEKEYERLDKLSFKSGVEVIKKLKQLKISIYAVHGNWDPTPYPFDLGGKAKESKKESLKPLTDKIFRLSDFSVIEEKDFILVCGGSSSSPGIISVKGLKEELKECINYSEVGETLLHFISAKRDFAKRENLYKRLFTKAKKIANKRPIIFLTHNCPYKTKLDIVKSKHAHKLARKKHVGSYLERKMIERFQPNIVLCGHIHESYGTDKVKKSFIYNIGSSLDGRFKILNI
jgi:Icc-related predicted phosphoesterase